MTDIKALACDYLAYYRNAFKQESFGQEHDIDDDELAYQAVDELVKTNANLAWDCILEMLAQSKEDSEVAWVAAGPLEDHLRAYGYPFVDKIEHAIKHAPNFKKALSAVYLDASENNQHVKVLMKKYKISYASL